MKKNVYKLFVIFIILGFLFTACDFIALGPLVNTEYPDIKAITEPGAYLSGEENLIYLDVIQKFPQFEIVSVYIDLWYTDHFDAEQYEKINAWKDEKTGFWVVNIDTTGMKDGNIRILVTAIDVDGKDSTTTDMIYIVKNSLPQLEMAFPQISGHAFDDPELNNKLALKPIIQGNELIGIVSDSYGIKDGYPRIMFWPADLDENNSAEAAKWKQWRTVLGIDGKELNTENEKVSQFRWPLVELIQDEHAWRLPRSETSETEYLPPGYYNFKFQVMDKLGIENNYPDRMDHSLEPGAVQNEYIQIRIMASENPVIYIDEMPHYYNGKTAFTAKIRIKYINPEKSVRAKVTNNENVDFNGVNEVEPILDKIEGGFSFYTITIPIDKMPVDDIGITTSGEKTLHVEATDVEDKIGDSSRTFILDIIEPTLEFIEPAGFESAAVMSVTSRLTFRGVAGDNDRVSKMWYALGRTETNAADLTHDPNTNTGWRETGLSTGSPVSHPGAPCLVEWRGSLSSWSLYFDDINEFAGLTNFVTETGAGTNKWRLPIYFKVADRTGNVNIFQKEVIIDPSLDLPKVEIISHENEDDKELVVGGTVRVNGMARDNEMIHNVEVRITRQTDAACDSAAAPSEVTENWTPVTLIGNRSSEVGWYYDLIGNNLNTPSKSLFPPAGKGSRKVIVEFRAQDAYANTPNSPKPLRGNEIKKLEISFSRIVPDIAEIKIQQGSSLPSEYIPNTRVTGTITITAKISSVTPLSKITYLAQEITNPSMTFNSGTSRYEYNLSINQNTNAWYNLTAGSYNLTIQAFDSVSPTPNRVQVILYLDVDNFYPLASFNGSLNAVGNYTISGAAQDRTAGIDIQGIHHIVVYFSRNGSGIPLSEEAPVSAFVNAAQQAMIGRTSAANGTLTALSVFPNVRGGDGVFATNTSGIVIDNNGVFNGRSMSFTGNPDKNWSVVFDSTKLKDGPVTLHYVVFDNVGNASHYTQNINIANNYPVINSIELGTDILGSGSVAAQDYESFTVGRTELPTGFRIRNDLFNVKLNVSGGNGNKSYRVYYVTRGASAVNASTIEKGRVYTISTPGDIQWINYGVFERPAGNNYAGITFVATSNYIAGSGSGTVWAYTGGAAATEKSGSLTGNPVIQFTNTSFSSSLIPDSPKDSNGNITAANARYFIVKVYDSTVTPSVENDQLAHAAVIALDIDNDDVLAPDIKIAPFFWNSAASNSLYGNSKANGHIELEADLQSPGFASGQTGIRDLDPKVSGKVSFRGTVSDNIALGTIYFRIVDSAAPNTRNFTHNAAAAGGPWSGEGGAAYYLAAEYSNGSWTTPSSETTFTNNGWKFSVVNEYHDQRGHKAAWQLDFDSRFIRDTARANNLLTVVARDASQVSSGQGSSNPGSFTQTSGAVEAAQTAHYRFDVVPYISGISTNVRSTGNDGWGLKDNNIRSADGKYSVIQGSNASFITVRGFNLAGSARIFGETSNTAFRNNPGAVPSGSIADVTVVANADNTSFTMTNNRTNSGYLTVIVNSIGSLNNINNNAARESAFNSLSAADGSRQEQMPNREPDRYTTKNITLTDDRYIQFYAVRKTGVKDGYFPSMVVWNNKPVFGYINHRGEISGFSAGTSEPVQARIQRAEFNLDGTFSYLEYLLKVGSNSEQMVMAIDDAGRFGHYTSASFGPNGYSNGGSSDYIYDRYAELWNRPNNGLTKAGWARGITNVGGDEAYENNRISTFNSHNTAINFEAPMDFGYAQEFSIQNGAVLANYVPNVPRDGVGVGTIAAQQFAENASPKMNRFIYPKLLMKGNSITNFAANYLAYFDEGTSDKQIIFRTFQVGTSEAGTSGERRYRLSHHSAAAEVDRSNRKYQTWTNYPVGRLDGSTNGLTTNALWNDERYILGNYGRNIAVRGASRYFDMSLAGTGTDNRVVIVYYDESAGHLRLSYSNNTINGGNTSSNAHAFTENTGINFPASVGMYVSMDIDSSGRIHIAAFDSINSELKYIFINSYNATSCTTVTVDQYGSVGSWADIKVRNGVPYIAYYNAAEGGGRESIKIAFAKNAITSAATAAAAVGVNANGYTAGGWEYRTVPALDPPQGGINEFQKVNLDFLNDGRPVLGYLAANLEFSYEIGE